MSTQTDPLPESRAGLRPFRNAVLRGLGVVLPPLVTIAIFFWLGGTIYNYLLEPVSAGVQNLVALAIQDLRQKKDFSAQELAKPNPSLQGNPYQALDDGTYVPKAVYDVVKGHLGEQPMPRTGRSIYRAYLRVTYLRPSVTIPVLVCALVLVLYILGKLIAAGVGRFAVNLVERGILRVPLVSSVYYAVKQVSSFLLAERKLNVSRVVAVEYPRKGVWALGLVTGEGMAPIESVVGDQCISVMICTSPMPMAGFTITIRRSEAIDLNITLDQAIQFIVSCGVVVPKPKQLEPAQRPEASPRPSQPGAAEPGGPSPGTP
ncbi:MAG: DUF502 domain-containing protein [Thermoguttaceae bacterium]